MSDLLCSSNGKQSVDVSNPANDQSSDAQNQVSDRNNCTTNTQAIDTNQQGRDLNLPSGDTREQSGDNNKPPNDASSAAMSLASSPSKEARRADDTAIPMIASDLPAEGKLANKWFLTPHQL